MKNSFGEERLKATFGVDLNEAVDTVQNGITLYVNREFSGLAGVTVTASGLTTTNPSYAAQWNSAVVGNPAKPFPCPWSANVVAKQIAAATGRMVTVRVFAGNTYTFGSSTLSQNGSSAADYNVNEEPDIKVANVAADMYAVSLGQHNVTHVFEEDTVIICLCKAFTLRLVYLPETTQDWKTRILGKGEFRWLYGQGQGSRCCVIDSINVYNLDLVFQGHKMLMNQDRGFQVLEFKNVVVDFDKWYDYNTQFSVYSYTDWVTAGRSEPKCFINIRDRRRGYGLFTGMPPAYNDYWSSNAFYAFYGGYFSITFDSYLVNDIWSGDGVFLSMGMPGSSTAPFRNNTVIYNINRMVYNMVDGNGVPNPNQDGGLIRATPATNDSSLYTNNNFVFNFGTVKSMAGLKETRGVGIMTRYSKTTYTVNVIGTWENTSAVNAAIFLESNVQNDENNNMVIVKGNFLATGGAPLVKIAQAAGLTTSLNGVAYHFKNCELVQKVAGKPAVDLGNAWTNFNVFFDNCKIVNDGAAEVISKTATNAPMNVLCSNTWTNGAPVSANMVAEGDALKTNTRLGNVLNR